MNQDLLAALEAEARQLQSAFETRLDPQPARRQLQVQIASRLQQLADSARILSGGVLKEDPECRYYGLDPLKISALKLGYHRQTHEQDYLALCLEELQLAILTQILQRRWQPGKNRKARLELHPQDLLLIQERIEQERLLLEQQEKEKAQLEAEIETLRTQYEAYLFEESSYEAARSFGTHKPELSTHRSSWAAFSRVLTSLALESRSSERAALLREARAIEAERGPLFESCAKLLAAREKADKGASKKLRRQLRQNLTKLKDLEERLNKALDALPVPGLDGEVALVVKKTSDQAKTIEPTHPSSGEK